MSFDPRLICRALNDAGVESKRAAGRLKDARALPYLESLRDEIRRRAE